MKDKEEKKRNVSRRRIGAAAQKESSARFEYSSTSACSPPVSFRETRRPDRLTREMESAPYEGRPQNVSYVSPMSNG